jgi:uncharacterized protein (TIGR02145 family)
MNKTMNNSIGILLLFLIGTCFFLSNGCKKEDNDNTPLSVTDIEGNVYHAVIIGTQTWMVENLKTTRYNDSTIIPLVENASEWSSLTTPGYCWYNNDEATNKDTYGALYNWYAVNTHKLCPKGWHVPTTAELVILSNFLGGEDVAGGKLKETGTIHWFSPNTGADNKSGFSALPAGNRGYGGVFGEEGSFYYQGIEGAWWSSSIDGMGSAWYHYISNGYAGFKRSSALSKQNGFSVRCVRD